MKTQLRLILCICFVYIIQIHWIRIDAKRFSRCPQVANDEDVVTLKQFTIPLNPAFENAKSYGKMDTKGYIFQLKLVNEKFIPLTIFALRELRRLEIRNSCFPPCDRQHIPSDIKCLASSLTELDIYDTKITHLPDEINKLNKLKTLKLSNTGLMSLPENISGLTALRILYLPKNNLQSLPPSIRSLKALQQITLTQNPNLHSIEILTGLPSLRILHAQQCSIKILPEDLPELTSLDMSENLLTRLKGMGSLGTESKNPKSYSFDHNRIVSILPGMDQIQNLRRLKLDHNHLHQLPREIFNIPTMTHLNIEYNQFTPSYLQFLISEFRLRNPKLEFLSNNQNQSYY